MVRPERASKTAWEARARFEDSKTDCNPQLLERYYHFHEMGYRQFAAEWLEANEIDANLTFRPLPPLTEEPHQRTGKRADEVISEFPLASDKSGKATCRVTVHRPKSGSRVHIEGWANGRATDKGLTFSPDDLPVLIEALQEAKNALAGG